MTQIMVTALMMLLALAGCQPEPSPTPPPDGTSARPDLVGLIEWDRSPTAVVFRAEQTGNNQTDFFRLGDIPDCTIYGDNSIVYLLPAASGGTIVAVDKVHDDAIRTFVEDVTLNYQLFNQESGASELDSSLLPPLYEAVSIAINGQRFSFDSLGGWPDDYYPRITERCRAVSSAPAEFVPESGAWVTVERIDYDPNQPARAWDAVATGVDLIVMSDKGRQWLRGAGGVALWDLLRTAGRDVQIQQGEDTFRVVMQVPGITLNSPAAP